MCPVADDLLDNKYLGILLCSYDFRKRCTKFNQSIS